MGLAPHRSTVMSNPSQSEFGPLGDPRDSSIVGAVGVLTLFGGLLVAVSYPVVTVALAVGALIVPLARRVAEAVASFRARRAATPRTRSESTVAAPPK
jgi:hypothetical protein